MAGATVYLEVELQHVTGMFIAGDELAEAVTELIDGESIDVDDSEYEVVSCCVYYPPKPSKRRR